MGFKKEKSPKPRTLLEKYKDRKARGKLPKIPEMSEINRVATERTNELISKYPYSWDDRSKEDEVLKKCKLQAKARRALDAGVENEDFMKAMAKLPQG